jgi:hypothetical protein
MCSAISGTGETLSFCVDRNNGTITGVGSGPYDINIYTQNDMLSSGDAGNTPATALTVSAHSIYWYDNFLSPQDPRDCYAFAVTAGQTFSYTVSSSDAKMDAVLYDLSGGSSTLTGASISSSAQAAAPGNFILCVDTGATAIAQSYGLKISIQ